MSSAAEDLLSGLEKKDASLFGRACGNIQAPACERREVWRQLISIFRETDTHRAELAVNALRFSGLVLDGDCYEELIPAAEERFSADKVAKLAADYEQGQNHLGKELLKRLRLLRSTFHAVLRTGDPRGQTLVRRVEDELAGTALGRRVAGWRQQGGSSGDQ